jgi:hypothetical protein
MANSIKIERPSEKQAFKSSTSCPLAVQLAFNSSETLAEKPPSTKHLRMDSALPTVVRRH